MKNAEETGNANRHCPEKKNSVQVAFKDHTAESYKLIY